MKSFNFFHLFPALAAAAAIHSCPQRPLEGAKDPYTLETYETQAALIGLDVNVQAVYNHLRYINNEPDASVAAQYAFYLTSLATIQFHVYNQTVATLEPQNHENQLFIYQALDTTLANVERLLNSFVYWVPFFSSTGRQHDIFLLLTDLKKQAMGFMYHFEKNLQEKADYVKFVLEELPKRFDNAIVTYQDWKPPGEEPLPPIEDPGSFVLTHAEKPLFGSGSA